MRKNKIKISVCSAVVLCAVLALNFERTFADTTSVTESVAVTVSSTCGLYTMQGSPAALADAPATVTYTNTLSAGATWTAEDHDTTSSIPALGTQYYVKCNDSKGWTIAAIGAGEVTGDATKMKGAASGTNIDTSATEPTASDTAASWAFELKAVDGVIATAHSGVTVKSYMAVPSSATTIVDGTSDASGDASFTTGYRVHIGTATAADTYTGKVKYTLAAKPAVSGDGGGTQNDQQANQQDNQQTNQDAQNPPVTQNNDGNPEPTPTFTSAPPVTNYYNTTSNPTYTTETYTTYDNTVNNTTSSTNDGSAGGAKAADDTTSTKSSDSNTSALGVVKTSADANKSDSEQNSTSPILIAATIAVAATAAVGAGGYIVYDKTRHKE